MKKVKAVKEEKDRKKLLIIILLFLILIICVGGGLYFMKMNTSPGRETINIESGQEGIENETPAYNEEMSGKIQIPGYQNLIADDTDPYITINNPEGNNVYMQYIMTDTDTGEVIYEGSLLNPGKQYKLNIASLLSKGEHVINFEIKTYSVVTNEVCNGAKQDVLIKID